MCARTTISTSDVGAKLQHKGSFRGCAYQCGWGAPREGSAEASPLAGSSEAEAMSILGGASSREESSDSVVSLMSTGSSPSPSRRAAPFQQSEWQQPPAHTPAVAAAAVLTRVPRRKQQRALQQPQAGGPCPAPVLSQATDPRTGR